MAPPSPNPKLLRNYFELERQLRSAHGDRVAIIVTSIDDDGSKVHTMYGWVLDANGKPGTLGVVTELTDLPSEKVHTNGYVDVERVRIGELIIVRGLLRFEGWCVHQVLEDALQDMYPEEDISAPLA